MNKKLNIRDRFAYDLSKDVVNKGEIWDTDVLNQSIEMIIATSYGERVFNLGFGSPLSLALFEGMTNSNGEKLIDDLITAIEKWEDRVTVISSDVSLTTEENGYTLSIPYIINKNNIKSVFKKKIIQ